jgi:DnaJ like chaperone protein
LDGLFFVAISDGVVTGDELAYLARVSELFGQSPLVFRRLKATHLGPDAGDPYAVLGVAHDASDADLRTAWRVMLSEAHPDRAWGRGLPPEFIEVAEAKAAAINAAFDAAMRERRALSLQGAV